MLSRIHRRSLQNKYCGPSLHPLNENNVSNEIRPSGRGEINELIDLIRPKQSDFLFAHGYSQKDSEDQHEEYVIQDNQFKIKTVL